MSYILNNPGDLLGFFGEHLQLTLLSLGIALLLGLPLGIAGARVAWLRSVLLGLFGVIYTIPSLALLVLLIPLTGLSQTTAIIALVAYAQLVLVRNTIVGLTGVDPAVIEAARGMGMGNWQRFWRVELPLALPLILAGVRVAAVSIVGIGTVAAFISAGGLGTLLFDGLRTSNNQKVVAGAIAVALLAALLNIGIRALERRVTLAIYGEEA
jgi:osmoprotectant transport system permease protein